MPVQWLLQPTHQAPDSAGSACSLAAEHLLGVQAASDHPGAEQEHAQELLEAGPAADPAPKAAGPKQRKPAAPVREGPQLYTNPEGVPCVRQEGGLAGNLAAQLVGHPADSPA